MIIKTGLEPYVEQPVKHPVRTPPRFEFAHPEGVFAVRLSDVPTGKTWRVLFKDSDGRIHHALVAGKKPECVSKWFVLELPLGSSDDYQQGALDHRMSSYGAPEDAVVTREEIVFKVAEKVTVSWWEVTV